MTQTIAQTSVGPIEYRREGSGPVVLVLNGGHCSRTTRLSHERLTTEGFTVLTPSRPGYDATPAQVGRTAQQAAAALAALLDSLAIPAVTVLGISAAGPTALAFAQQHPDRTTGLILESAVTLPWDTATRRAAHWPFGRLERHTWALVRFGLRWMPTLTLRGMLQAFTTRPAAELLREMRAADRQFVLAMLLSMQSGSGFLLDLAHTVDGLDRIQTPTLVMYSPHDRSVPPRHAHHVAQHIAGCQLYAAPADSHLIWIGPQADQVWQTRLAFLHTVAGAT
jgi:pimeloyl-ACP methyl ester carboxylesterase